MSERKAPESPHYFETWIARRNLRKAAAVLLNFPYGEDTEITIEKYDTCSRARKFNVPYYTNLADGVAVSYTTEEWLEDRSHRFIFPDEGELAYHREAFNVDCQKIPSKTLNLAGIEVITSDPLVLPQARMVASWTLACAQNNWEGMEQARTPQAQC